MTSKVLVSIITPTYNSEDYVDATIQSVCDQTFTDWELVVVDDCSTDSTVERVRVWQKADSRIKLLCNPENLGPGPTRNRAMQASEGRYIAFLDSDDIWLPNKLTVQLAAMRSAGAVFSFTSYEMIDRTGAALGRVVRAPRTLCYAELLRNTVIGCLTVMVDRSEVGTLEMPNIPSRQPLVLWLRILKQHGPGLGVADVLARYRVRPGSISSDKMRAARQVWRVYREYEGLSLFRSARYFFSYALKAGGRNIGVGRNRQ